jgi:hypothetical protein
VVKPSQSLVRYSVKDPTHIPGRKAPSCGSQCIGAIRFELIQRAPFNTRNTTYVNIHSVPVPFKLIFSYKCVHPIAATLPCLHRVNGPKQQGDARWRNLTVFSLGCWRSARDVGYSDVEIESDITLRLVLNTNASLSVNLRVLVLDISRLLKPKPIRGHRYSSQWYLQSTANLNSRGMKS